MKKVTLIFGFTLCLILSAVVVLNAGWWVYTVTEPASSGGNCTTLAQSRYDSTTGSYTFGTTASMFAGGKFTANSSYTVCKIAVALSTSNTDYNIRAHIYSHDSANDQPLTDLGYSDWVALSNIGSSETKVFFENMNVSLTGGTDYWIVLEVDTAGATYNWYYCDTDKTRLMYDDDGTGTWTLKAASTGAKYEIYQ